MYKLFCPRHKEVSVNGLKKTVKEVLDTLDKGSRPENYIIFCPIRGCKRMTTVMWLLPRFVFQTVWNDLRKSDGICLSFGELKSITTNKVIETMKHRANIQTT